MISKELVNQIDGNSDDFFKLSYPDNPDIFQMFIKKFPGFPVLIIDQDYRILFGHDFYPILCQYCDPADNQPTLEYLQITISKPQGLILNYNLKNSLIPLNLYEKLVFLKRIVPFYDIKKIQSCIDLDFPVNQELIACLDQLLDGPAISVLQHNRLHLRHVLRILQLDALSQSAIFNLFFQIPFSYANQVQLIEMTEELLFREKTDFSSLLVKMGIMPDQLTTCNQTAIIKEFFKFRYPLVWQQREIENDQIKKLALPENYRIITPPFFEKETVELRIHFTDFVTLKESLKRLYNLPEA